MTAPSPTNLALMLRRWRINEQRQLRDVAAEIGFSAATLCRLEQGYMPDADTFMKLLNWVLKKAKDSRRPTEYRFVRRCRRRTA